MKCPKTHREKLMPERAQDAIRLELDQICQRHRTRFESGDRSSTYSRMFLDEVLAWHEAHQPPTLSRERVASILGDSGFGPINIGQSMAKKVVDELCALALPPRPAVTLDQIKQVFNRHDHQFSSREDWFIAITAALHRLCTGAGEEPLAETPQWCEHWLPEIWCGRPAFARRTGTVTDVIYLDSSVNVKFCDRCGAPKPEGR